MSCLSSEYWQVTNDCHCVEQGESPAIFLLIMALVVFLGQKPTGGYVVMIASVWQVGSQLVVHYRVSGPHSDQAVTQVMTSPYAIAIVPACHLTAVFRGKGSAVTPGLKD